MQVVAVIPAYNEKKAVRDVARAAAPFVQCVIVVDDGSTDRTSEAAREAGARVVHHALNRGLGAALGTGFAAALALGADAVVTLDADGQHDPSEIPLFLAALSGGADLVVGSRMRTGLVGMPLHRKAATLVGNLATLLLFGAWVTDSQSGYRALSRRALERIDIRTNRMEVSSELIHETRVKGLVYTEVSIRAIYTDYSLSKGQSFTVGVRTLMKLILRRLVP